MRLTCICRAKNGKYVVDTDLNDFMSVSEKPGYGLGLSRVQEPGGGGGARRAAVTPWNTWCGGAADTLSLENDFMIMGVSIDKRPAGALGKFQVQDVSCFKMLQVSTVSHIQPS